MVFAARYADRIWMILMSRGIPGLARIVKIRNDRCARAVITKTISGSSYHEVARKGKGIMIKTVFELQGEDVEVSIIPETQYNHPVIKIEWEKGCIEVEMDNCVLINVKDAIGEYVSK